MAICEIKMPIIDTFKSSGSILVLQSQNYPIRKLYISDTKF
jgi:hypothetical protein